MLSWVWLPVFGYTTVDMGKLGLQQGIPFPDKLKG